MINKAKEVHFRIRKSPLANRYLSGAYWSVVAAVVSNILTLLSMMLVARFLGKNSYGQFVVIQSTLGMFGVFAGFGIGAAAIRYVAEFRHKNLTRLSNILGLAESTVFIISIIATIVLIIVSDVVSSKVLNTPSLSFPLAISAFSVFFLAHDAYQKSILIGLEAMRAFALGTILSAFISVPILLLSASIYGLNGLAVAMVLNSLIQATISRYQVELQLRIHSINIRFRGCLGERRILFEFALPALIASALVLPSHWLCQAMLANTANGYAELAILGVAIQWFNVILFLPNVAGRIVLPILTERLATGNNEQALKLLKLAVLSNLAVVIPVSLLISFLSPFIMSAYGSEFVGGWKPLSLLSLIAILVVGATPIGQLLAAKNRMWLGSAMNLGWACIFIIFTMLFVSHGALGIVWALGIAYLMHSFWVGWYALRNIS